jgi:hypothetical protein
MAQTATKAAIQKLALSASRDIPFNKLLLSACNVRRIKAGVSIEQLADDIARRTLLQSLTVRPVLDADGGETGMYEIPAGGRRYRALELLVQAEAAGQDRPRPLRDPRGRHSRRGLPGRERAARAAAPTRPVPCLPGAARARPVRGGNRRRVLRRGDRGQAAATAGVGVAQAARRLRGG